MGQPPARQDDQTACPRPAARRNVVGRKKREQSPTNLRSVPAGTARRVLRTNGDCPLFPVIRGRGLPAGSPDGKFFESVFPEGAVNRHRAGATSMGSPDVLDFARLLRPFPAKIRPAGRCGRISLPPRCTRPSRTRDPRPAPRERSGGLERRPGRDKRRSSGAMEAVAGTRPQGHCRGIEGLRDRRLADRGLGARARLRGLARRFPPDARVGGDVLGQSVSAARRRGLGDPDWRRWRGSTARRATA